MSILRGKAKDKVYYVAATPFIMYGWKTYDFGAYGGLTEADLKTQLGFVDGESLTPDATKIYIFRANAPKPARVSKKTNNRKW